MAGLPETASKVLDVFSARHGARPALYSAPGRVNLIGEHTDYNGGFVCPIALGLRTYIAAAPNASGLFRVYSTNKDEERRWTLDQALSTPKDGHWSDYVRGVAQQLHRAGLPVSPVDLVIGSDVPEGAGVSSSAALEVATALSLLAGRELPPLVLAQLCQQAEREFVGMPCGIMDQYISVFGEPHHAVQLDCRALRHELIRLPQGVTVMAVNSLVKHELSGSEYPKRVAECQAACEALGVRSLREATPEMVSQSTLQGKPRIRAQFVTEENRRVQRFGVAAMCGDLRQMGELFYQSHAGMRDLYEITCREIDYLVEATLRLEGVFGARMTGGGFGGCTVNLVASGAEAEFASRLSAMYESEFGVAPVVFRCDPSAGAA